MPVVTFVAAFFVHIRVVNRHRTSPNAKPRRHDRYEFCSFVYREGFVLSGYAFSATVCAPFAVCVNVTADRGDSSTVNWNTSGRA